MSSSGVAKDEDGFSGLETVLCCGLHTELYVGGLVLFAPFGLSGVCGNAYGAVFDIGSGGSASAEKRKNQIHKKYI